VAEKKIAWITGGGTGMGLAAAIELVKDGWTVVVSGRRADVLDKAVKEIGRNASALVLDVASKADVERAAKQIIDRHGRIDLLVNSAGLNVPNRSWTEMTTEGWDKVVSVNLDGLLYCMHAVLPAMRAQKSGTIINVSSWAGRLPSKITGPAYAATKHAVVALTHSFNMEEFRNGLRACALCPGEAATEILRLRPVQPTAEEKARMLQAEDIGRTIAFIAGMPPHVCINEILISPTWNRSFL
jgi:NADP-dependent 3-hydroxy acid dehydrogenase YdfG